MPEIETEPPLTPVEKPIAYLVEANKVVCFDCDQSNYCDIGHCVLFVGNIYPYKQSCHSCGKVIVQGQSDAWSELYPKRVCDE